MWVTSPVCSIYQDLPVLVWARNYAAQSDYPDDQHNDAGQPEGENPTLEKPMAPQKRY